MDEDNLQRVRRKFLNKHDKEDLKHHYKSAKQHRLKIMALFKKKKKQEKDSVEEKKRDNIPSYPPSKKEEQRIQALEKREPRIEGKRKQYRTLDDSKVKEMARLFDENEEKQKGTTKQRPTVTAHRQERHKQATKHVKRGTTSFRLDDRLAEEHPKIRKRVHEEPQKKQEKREEDQETIRIPTGMDPTSDVYLQKLRELRRGQPVKSKSRSSPLIKIEREKIEKNTKEKEVIKEKEREKAMEILHPVKTGIKIGFGFLIMIILVIAVALGVTYLLDVFGISITGMLGLG